MGITEASIFLTSTLLICLGIIIIVSGAIIINNMIHRWWKPLTWSVVPNDWKQVVKNDYDDLETSARKNIKEPTLDEIKK